MPQYDLEQYQSYRLYSRATFSPDGHWIAYATRPITTNDNAIWQQAVEPDPTEQPTQTSELIPARTGITWGAAWSPDGRSIAITAPRAETGVSQLHVTPPHGGWLHAPLADPTERHELGPQPFSPDGRLIAYRASAQDRVQLKTYAPATGEARLVLADAAPFMPLSWSPDNRLLLLWRENAFDDHDLYLCDLATGLLRQLTPHVVPARFWPGPWSPEGDGFYLRTDLQRDWTGLAFMGTQGDLHWRETPDWDVEHVGLAQGGRYLAWVVNEDGYSRLYARDRVTGEARRIAALPDGHITTPIQGSPSAPVVVFTFRRTVCPPDLWAANLATGATWPLSRGYPGGVPEEAIVEPQLVRYPSADGRQIPAYLYKPRGLAPDARVPVVLSIHGGIEQMRPGYHWEGLHQALTDRGIGVLATNIRGSTGYGNTYTKALWSDWGGAELLDLEHAAHFLRDVPWVDERRLGLVGHSLGGFEVLSCLSRLPQYWAVGVALAGPPDLIRHVADTPPEVRPLMERFVGDPVADEARLRARSPLTHLAAIRAPLLVIQGSADRLVPQARSDELVERLRALGGTVEYLLLEGAGHDYIEFSAAQRLTAYRTIVAWLERHLL